MSDQRWIKPCQRARTELVELDVVDTLRPAFGSVGQVGIAE